jgi:protease-4
MVSIKNKINFSPINHKNKIMKSFLKYLLATIVGIILSSLILFFIFLGIMSIAMSSQDKATELKPGTILYLKLDKQIVDREPVLPFAIGGIGRNQQLGLNTILENIEKAKTDDNIEGIHLDIRYVQAGIGTIEEIRNALLDFKESGKFITVYSDILSQGAYYLASASDEIYFNPVGFFNLVGLRIQSPFFKNALKKLDIETYVIRHGKFKSAGEQFTENGYSVENSEQLQRLISTIWDDFSDKIAEARGLSSERINEIADNLLVQGPNSAYELGLFDSLLYKEQVITLLKDKTGVDDSKDLRTVGLGEYKNVPKHREYKGLAKDKIAVIYASGSIVDGDGDDTSIGSDKFTKEIRKARKDSSIKAIVLRVNSPGGSAIASENIWHELKLTRNAKPIVVSMGNLAASGGYYISCMADSILIQPNTITGSIGVYSMFLNTKGFFSKFGVTFDIEKTNDYSDFMSGVRSPKPLEVAFWQAQVDSFYNTFVKRVEQGRPLSNKEIDEVGQGRVWSGIDAIELGLADREGGLADAIEVARNMAGLGEKYRIIELPVQENPIEKIIRELSQSVHLRAIEKSLGINSEYLHTVNRLMESQGLMTRIPFDIEIY